MNEQNAHDDGQAHRFLRAPQLQAENQDEKGDLDRPAAETQPGRDVGFAEGHRKPGADGERDGDRHAGQIRE
jgi:hypothetical protein